MSLCEIEESDARSELRNLLLRQLDQVKRRLSGYLPCCPSLFIEEESMANCLDGFAGKFA